MADVQNASTSEMADAAPAVADPETIFRADYRPPDWLIPAVALDFHLGLARTAVIATLTLKRNGEHARPLRLDHDEVAVEELVIDGEPVDWREEDGQLVVDGVHDGAHLTMRCAVHPDKNTKLEGLYASNDMLCTQCEAEGFRRIIPFVDRPDNLSVYTVMMRGPKNAFPVLLSNGEITKSADCENGDHYVCWHDPWPKPSYLFALVAGDLAANSDRFTTMSGKDVELNIYVRDGDLDRTGHAMKALKDSMRWDEQVYGREYDLGLFNIVAVSDFNMGAMENKGLNIFNSRYVLADPEVATDADFDGIEGVVAHEYFHNWSGNRVTCRDWFQLSLKEGFTVFRDQNFSADMGSPALKRIEDVRILRAAQFPEDAGPLAHSIRPDSYQEISNFYTATVYNKGAEVIRMMHSLMGAQKFRRGTDLYFDRHDGEAATCENFVQAMENGGDIDLGQFRRWYETPGTPRISVQMRHDPQHSRVTLKLAQNIAQNGEKPRPSELVIPLRTALLDPKTGGHDGEQMIILDQPEQEVVIDGPAEPPVLSINRGFSAPIILEAGQTAEELAFLSAHDDDPFARFEAMQQLVTNYLTARVSGAPTEREIVLQAIGAVLKDETIDPAFQAELILLPSEAFLGDQMAEVDPQAIHEARESLRGDLATTHQAQLQALYDRCEPGAFSLESAARAKRKLRNVSLGYLAAAGGENGSALAFAQYQAADNMTARQGALAVLSHLESNERDQAFGDFFQRYRDNALVLDKWFMLQAMSQRAGTAQRVQGLANHPDFTLANPNRVRSLYGAFTNNQVHFHNVSGTGYDWVADMVIALDKQNPQTAARFVPPLGRWRRFERGRSELMRLALERIAAQPELSKDVAEQVHKSLA